MPTPVKQRKMTADLLLGVRLNLIDKLTLLKLSDIDLREKVEKLREYTAERAEVSKDSFDLIYCGLLLKNDSTLESCGLKHGSMVHVLGRKKLSADSEKKDDKSLTNVKNAFSSFANNPLLEIAVRRMTKKPEVIDKIIAQSPELKKDAVAIAMLQDPDLITYFGDSQTAERLAKEHPALIKAADLIVKAVTEEAQSFAASSRHLSLNSSSASSHAWSNMETMSDDDEMAGDSSQSSDSPQAQPSGSGGRTYPAISAAHVLHAITRARRSAAAAAVANMTSGGSGGSNNSTGPTAGSSGLQSNGGGIITAEMFNQAIENAFASVPALSNVSSTSSSTPSSTPTPTPSTTATTTATTTTTMASSAGAALANPSNGGDGAASSSVPLAASLQQQITLMREMGLHDDAINLQALQVTNGDVQAAIELVLNALTDN